LTSSTWRKRPVEIQAIQWTGYNIEAVAAFMGVQYTGRFSMRRDSATGEFGRRLLVPTLEGEVLASPGDWIIRGVQGEYYPCKPDIFAATYESTEGRSVTDQPSQAEAIEPKLASLLDSMLPGVGQFDGRGIVDQTVRVMVDAGWTPPVPVPTRPV
jgi:hypothetical protein